MLCKTLKIEVGTLFCRLLDPFTSSKCGFRVGRSSLLRFSRFFYEITFSNDFPSILAPLGAPFGRPWGRLGGTWGHKGPLGDAKATLLSHNLLLRMHFESRMWFLKRFGASKIPKGTSKMTPGSPQIEKNISK